MKKWTASDFMKDFEEFGGADKKTVEIVRERILPSKLEKYKENEKVKEDVTPVFEIVYIEDNGFGVYSCKDENGAKFSIKGNFMKPLRLNKTYSVEGIIEKYKDEKQLLVEKVETSLPKTKEGVIRYLQTLKGLKTRAEAIYDVYGDKSLEVLKEKPLEVANLITGIGKKSVLSWQKELAGIEESENEMIYLMEIGLKPYQAKVLYKKYKDKVVEKIKENPYILSKELERFGFLKADNIARNMGYELDDDHRIKEGVIYALEAAIYEGHCYLPKDELIEKASDLLDVFLTFSEMSKYANEKKGDFVYNINGLDVPISYDKMMRMLKENSYHQRKNQKSKYKIFEVNKHEVESQLKVLILEGRAVLSKDKVYLEELYHAEMEVGQHIRRIVDYEKRIEWKVEDELKKYCENKNIQLEEKQKEAVIKFSSSKGGFYILNGSAGTGKTFTLKIIIDMLKSMYKALGESPRTLLLAPTGKASKVATKATGMECKTIHRGLKYNPMAGFVYNSSNPFDEDIIIVDETSMLDIMLAKHLLSAIKYGAKVIFIGDTKQLPSVGPGNVLKDLINSNKVNTVTLNVPKRQTSQSGIIANAQNIINGKMIEKQSTNDAFLINSNNITRTRKELLSLFDRISGYKNYDFNDIQLLCPQKVGPIGTDYMNYLIQKKYNKEYDNNMILNKTIFGNNGEKLDLNFKKGDKVIHFKNNYNMFWYEKINNSYILKGEEYVGITNGECGVIEEIKNDKDDEGNPVKKIIVKYDEMYIMYENNTDELDHAYALTVHKFQGSSSPAIIAPIVMANYIMLDNNLFYTLYTRSETFITIVGEEKAVKHAIKTQRSKHRYTTLQEFL
jgi:exodeoxyribonuclease V alpha subunit